MDPSTTLWFNDPAQLIGFLVATLIPMITAAVTKWPAAASLKAWVTAALTTLTAVLATLWGDDCGCWQWALFAQNFFTTFVVAIATYYGFWKPTGAAPALAKMTRFGLGDPQPRNADGTFASKDGGAVDTRTLAIVAIVIAVIVLLYFIF